VTERALEPLFDLPVAEDTIPVDVPPSVEAEARLVVPHFQRYSSQERANLRSSHRLGPRQREAVGAHFFTHPDLPGLAFPTRVSAARAAVRAREKVPVGPVRMTSSQRWVLQGADQDGELQRVDGRIMPGLERRGWVVKTYRRQGRRTLTVWRLTLAGTAARDNAEVVEPAPRPEWLQTWPGHAVAGAVPGANPGPGGPGRVRRHPRRGGRPVAPPPVARAVPPDPCRPGRRGIVVWSATQPLTCTNTAKGGLRMILCSYKTGTRKHHLGSQK
jgi:hypothetical protein